MGVSSGWICPSSRSCRLQLFRILALLALKAMDQNLKSGLVSQFENSALDHRARRPSFRVSGKQELNDGN
jgi:hypothetical protein